MALNVDKTRLIEFGRFAAEARARRGLGKPETFQFLGFTHICGRTQGGRFLLLRYTAGARMRERLRQIKATLRRIRHRPNAEQGHWLGRVVSGYFAYHAVPTNCRALNSFHRQVVRHWLRAAPPHALPHCSAVHARWVSRKSNHLSHAGCGPPDREGLHAAALRWPARRMASATAVSVGPDQP